jgi:glycosyltransferase involved in cell wall biosynthesis
MDFLCSICIPTFNSEMYLEECLQSVLHQTIENFEVIIVDNCSTDKTLDIAQKYASLDNRVRVIQNTCNLGLVGNHNRCLELAQGEWIKFVHSDDFITPDCIDSMISASQADTLLVACARNYKFEQEVGEKEKEFFLKHLSEWSVSRFIPAGGNLPATEFSQAFLDCLLMNIIGEPTATLIRREAFYRFGVFNSNLNGNIDLELSTRIGVNAGITYVPDVLVTARIHENSFTSNNRSHYTFRKNFIEPLILLHDFAFDPIYAPLRDAAHNRQPSINFTKIIKKKLYTAQLIAHKTDVNSQSTATSFKSDLDKIFQLYPALLPLSKSNLADRFLFSSKKIAKKISGYWPETSKLEC